MSRTKNSFKNIIVGFGGQILVLLLKFITQTIFIRTLGKEYLGINGLFSNILSMLSLAELGVGSAITFNLYKPIEEKDQDKILVLMKLYKQIYRLIGLVIACIGVIMIPLLPYIIKNYKVLEALNINAVLIFLIYLMQTVSTYLFFAYKSAIIRAHQKEYVLTIIEQLFNILCSCIQIFILVVYKSFLAYTCTIVIMGIIQNLVFAIKADKMYPYLKNKSNNKLSNQERNEIFKDCSAIFIYKVNSVVLNSTDNIILSSFLGLEAIGLYSNYLFLSQALQNILSKVYDAIAPSLGSLHASGDIKREYDIFKCITFMTYVLFGTAAIGVFNVGNEFIMNWIGNDYVISDLFIFLIAIQIYIYGIQLLLSKFRNAMGLFQQAKYRPVAGMIINVLVSIIGVKYIGIYGVVLGTIIANITTFVWFDPLIIYKNIFNKPVFEYYLITIKYFCSTLLAGFISNIMIKRISGVGYVYVITHSFICVFVMALVVVLLYRRTEEYRYFRDLVVKILNKTLKKHDNLLVWIR